MEKVKVAIVGIGNCSSSLVQGISYYENFSGQQMLEEVTGLMRPDIAGLAPYDIEPVLAFDIDKRKVGKPLHEAIFSLPNCVLKVQENVKKSNVIVEMGNPLDGISEHMKDFPEDNRFVLAEHAIPSLQDVVDRLKATEAEVLISYLPVGSQKATEFYAEACLLAGVSLLNCVPVFIASNPVWSKRFQEAGIPLIGDDIKSQLGATITHRVLTRLCEERGIKIERMYQLNTGGNTDFLNMLNRTRLESKKISKTEAVQSQMSKGLSAENIHVGPSDYVPWQKDNKICFVRIEGRGFAGAPMELELRLSVQDSPNSAGVVIDAVRFLRLARDRGLAGPINSVSSYLMKHPPVQVTDAQAKRDVDDFADQSLQVQYEAEVAFSIPK